MKSILGLFVVAWLLAPLAAVQSAETSPARGPSHVIVPYSKEAARNGEASLIELRDGSLLLMYGAHQKSGDWDRGEIRQMRSLDDGKTWSRPETVFSDAKRSLFQIAFARLANGDLGLTHTSLANGRDAFKVFRRSTDEGKTWSEPRKISDDSHDYTTGPWDRLYVLASGRVIALLHCNLKPDANKQGGPLGTYTVFSDDYGKTWTRSPFKEVLHVPDNPLKKHEWGFWEPSLVEHAPGKLLLLGRTTTGWLWESRSKDNGTTWSKPVQSTVPNPVAPPVLTRVPGTETLVLIHNPDVKLTDSWHGGERLALAFRTSRDGGHTWSAPTDIYRSPTNKLWVDYPAVRWINGQLHLVWRHIDRGTSAGGLGGTSLYHHVLAREAFEARPGPKKPAESNAKSLRILPLGDSITRGSYLAQKDGKATGLPHPLSGGWRTMHQPLAKHYLQDSVEFCINSYLHGFKFNVTRTQEHGDTVFRDRFFVTKFNKVYTAAEVPRSIRVLDNAADVEERKLIESIYGVDLAQSKVIVTEFKLPMEAAFADDPKAGPTTKSGDTMWIGFMLDDNDVPGSDVQKLLVYPATYGTFALKERGCLATFE